MCRFRRAIALCLLLGGVLAGLAAQPVVRLSLASDSLRVGEPFEARLEIQHAPDVVVVFPSRRTRLAPFELVDARAEPTVTQAGRSRDVLTLALRTFEVADKQVLRLPYAYLSGRDTVWQTIASDTLAMVRLAPVPPGEEVGYRHSEDLMHWTLPRDYSWLVLLLAIALFVLGGVVFFLRRPLRRYLYLSRLSREWKATYRELTEIGALGQQEALFAQLNGLWRRYLDPDERLGLASMTTTELQQGVMALTHLSTHQQATLLEAATKADRVLYARLDLPPGEVAPLLRNLAEVLRATYEARRRQLLTSR
ncbi:MAG: hypothetical protein D6722_00780 [Bacteroidetes bacterium]|nr:MAG: hypothetical protein D6722_00780 [Bacteroidota bacterium]